MPYKNIVYAKLEKRLLNDARWFTMPESCQLLYLKLILAACESYNRVPKDPKIVRSLCRLSAKPYRILEQIEIIKQNFPKFKENGNYFYFEDFSEKTNYITDDLGTPKELPRNSQGLPKEAIEKKKIKKRKDKDKEQGLPKGNYAQPILYLNEKAQRSFSVKNKSSLSLIKARFAEGRTIDDFKKVIDRKVAQWANDPKMSSFLRPETLFNANKFDSYLNERVQDEHLPSYLRPKSSKSA